jgi:hypothetical protein
VSRASSFARPDSATALTTEEGAFIDGKISMTSPEAVQAEAESQEKAIEEVEAVIVEEEGEAEMAAEVPSETEEAPAGDVVDAEEISAEDEDTDEK